MATRTTRNAVEHASHWCSTLITPLKAVTWLTGVIRSLAHVGQRRARVSGSAGSGNGMWANTSCGLASLRASGSDQTIGPWSYMDAHMPTRDFHDAPQSRLVVASVRAPSCEQDGASMACDAESGRLGAMPTNPSDEPAAHAHALLERLFELLHDGRALVPKLEAGAVSESMSAQAERLLYFGLVGALEAGLVRTAENALTVLR